MQLRKKGGTYTLNIDKPVFNHKTTVFETSKPVDIGSEKFDAIKVNVIVLTSDASLETIPVPSSSWSNWPESIVDDLNREFSNLTIGYNSPEFELAKYTILESNEVEIKDSIKALPEVYLPNFSDHPFAETGAINMFFIGLPDRSTVPPYSNNSDGETFIDQRLHRKYGPVVVLDNNVSRDRLSHVRLVGNLVGFRSLDTFDWNDNILWGRSVTVDGRPGIPTINYHKLMHSNVENNLMRIIPDYYNAGLSMFKV